MKKLLSLLLLTNFIGGTAALNFDPKDNLKLQWDHFNLLSQFKLIQLGYTKKTVNTWNLKKFHSDISYRLMDKNESIDALIVYVVPRKYKVSNPLRAVYHTKKKTFSCCKDKYKGSYGNLSRSLEIENDTLKNSAQNLLIEELK